MVLPLPRRRRGLVVGLLFIALGLVVLASLLLSERAEAAEPVRVSAPPPAHSSTGKSSSRPGKISEVDRVEAAMIRLKQPYSDDPVIADSTYRNGIARAIVSAGEKWNIPSLFLTGLFFRESSFRKAVVEGRRLGALREYGLGQVNGVAKWWCMKSGFDLKTVDGQAICAAGWLDDCRKRCDGSLEQGFARYATGRSCSPRFAGDTFKDRFALWRALEEGTPIPKPPRH